MFAEGTHILKFSKRSQGPWEHVSPPHLVQSRKMVYAGSTQLVKIDIPPARKCALQEKDPLDIDNGGKIG